MIIDGNTLIAESNKVLIKGDIIATVVHLGINDSVDNWTETDPPEIISSEEETGRCCEKNEKQQRSNCSLICLFFSFKYTQ